MTFYRVFYFGTVFDIFINTDMSDILTIRMSAYIMNKKFFISGVWRGVDNSISHVMLHEYDGNSLGIGEKFDEKSIVNLIEKGIEVSTIIWNYGTGKWKVGEKVHLEANNSFLKTNPNKRLIDNLGNMINMKNFKF